ncbi:MAG: response regulator [Candidatus Hydrogenedentota bacterium]
MSDHGLDEGENQREPAMGPGESIDILVVEDNESERTSIVAALRAAIAEVRVASAGDGKEAMDFLLARGPWVSRAGEEPPKLILMDLAMPEADGFSVLGQIRSIEPPEALTFTPVVIFTDSNTADDVSRSYRCGANSYIIKPLSFPDFQSVVEIVGEYWMAHNKSVDPRLD